MSPEDNGNIDLVGTKYHNKGGPLSVERFSWQPPIVNDILRAAVEKGFGITDDLNGDKITGFTIAQTNSRNGVRISSASAFLRPISNRNNLNVALNATVTKIIFEGINAVGVQYIQVN